MIKKGYRYMISHLAYSFLNMVNSQDCLQLKLANHDCK